MIKLAEFTNSSAVTVAAGQNVPLTETAVAGKACIVHREGAGIVTLRGLTQQCKARYKVSFGANIAIPTGGTVEAISIALAVIFLRKKREEFLFVMVFLALFLPGSWHLLAAVAAGLFLRAVYDACAEFPPVFTGTKAAE